MQGNMQLLKLSTVLQRLGCSRSTVARWRANPATGFPQPRRLGQDLFWLEDELNDWIKEQFQVREPRPALADFAERQAGEEEGGEAC